MGNRWGAEGEWPGNRQGMDREQTGNVQGTYRERTWNVQGTDREQTGNGQGTDREWTRNGWRMDGKQTGNKLGKDREWRVNGQGKEVCVVCTVLTMLCYSTNFSILPADQSYSNLQLPGHIFQPVEGGGLFILMGDAKFDAERGGGC